MNPTHINKKTLKPVILLHIAENTHDHTKFAVYKHHTYGQVYTCIWTRFIITHKQFVHDDPVRKCNRHEDCNAADKMARERGLAGATHCRDEDCEDCFGR